MSNSVRNGFQPAFLRTVSPSVIIGNVACALRQRLAFYVGIACLLTVSGAQAAEVSTTCDVEPLDFSGIQTDNPVIGPLFTDRLVTVGNTSFPGVTFTTEITNIVAPAGGSFADIRGNNGGDFALARDKNGVLAARMTFSKPLAVSINEDESLSGNTHKTDVWRLTIDAGDYELVDPGTPDISVISSTPTELHFEVIAGDNDWRISMEGVSIIDAEFTALTNDNTSILSFSTCYGGDYSDAGAGYPPASHTTVPGIQLGSTVTEEGEQIADADDDSDDGILAFPTLTVEDTSYTIPAADIDASGTGILHAWIDFDNNGSFDSSEYASASVTNGVLSGDLSWTGVNTSSSPGTTYARFRLTSDASVNASTPGSAAVDGEVEDYQIAIEVPTSPTNPSATDDSFGVIDAGTASTLDILANDNGFLSNNDPLNPGTTTITRVGGTAGGTVSFDPGSGEMTYIPLSSEAGSTVTVDYEVCNTDPDPDVCDIATVTASVAAEISCPGLPAIDFGQGETGSGDGYNYDSGGWVEGTSLGEYRVASKRGTTIDLSFDSPVNMCVFSPPVSNYGMNGTDTTSQDALQFISDEGAGGWAINDPLGYQIQIDNPNPSGATYGYGATDNDLSFGLRAFENGGVAPSNSSIWAWEICNTNVSEFTSTNIGNGASSGFALRISASENTVCSAGQDHSDAPADGSPAPDGSSATTYGEATHAVVSGIHLGAVIDADASPVASAAADGDGADDDGVSLPSLPKGISTTIPVNVAQNSASEGYLQGWIDWNGDGDFTDAGEQIATDLQSASAGTSTINVSVTPPASAITEPTFARFRWSSTPGLDATTPANDGEVEDYQVEPLTPFPCTTSLYQVYGNSGISAEVDIINSTFNPLPNSPAGYAIYGTGYRTTDHLAYGFNKIRELVRLEGDGTATVLGPVTDAPTSGLYLSAAFDDEGYLYAHKSLSGTIERIDVETRTVVNSYTLTPNLPTSVSDIAYSPADDLLFGVTNGSYELYSIDPSSGATTFIGPLSPAPTSSGFGALYADVDGRLYGILNSTGEVYQINTSTAQSVIIGAASASSVNDGFSCHDAAVAFVDRSDAPADGSTAPDGSNTTTYGEARHEISPGLQLGSLNDYDPVSIHTVSADGDGANDDGVTFPILFKDVSMTIPVSITQPSGSRGYLQGWIDWNGDGDFADAGEQIATDLQSDSAGTSTINISVTPPVNAITNPTFARIRWSSTPGLGAITPANDGEVEDYTVTIWDSYPVTPQPITACEVDEIQFEELFNDGTNANWTSTQSANPLIGALEETNNIGNAEGTSTDVTLHPALNGGTGAPSPSGGTITGAFDASSGVPYWISPTLNIDISDAINGVMSFERWNWASGVSSSRYIEWHQDYVIIGDSGRLVLDYPTSTIVDTLAAGEWARIERRLEPSSEWFYVPNTNLGDNSGRTAATEAHFASVLASVQHIALNPESISGFDYPAVSASNAERYATDTIQLASCLPSEDTSDAPPDGDTLPSGATAAYGEASHIIVSGIQLGAAIDADDSPIASAAADGDGADDDGVTLPALVPGGTGTITVDVMGEGFLQAWIDWNGNGVLDSPVEQIATDMQDFGTGTISIPVTVPADATTAQTFARFRWSSDFGIGAAGPAPDGEVEDYALTLGASGPVLSGTVFNDNGIDGGSAHDAVLNGGEVASQNASVSLYDNTGTLIATIPTKADGTWTYTLPAGFSSPVTITVSPQPGWMSISEQTTGLPGLANNDAHDGSYTFTPGSNGTYSSLDFGLLEEPRLTQDQSVDISAGQVVELKHIYTATSSADVTLSLVDVLMTPDGAFSATLFEDTNCDGTPDTVINAPRAVTAGEIVCLTSRVVASSGVGPGAQVSYGITANSAFTNTNKTHALRNNDVIGTSVGGDQLSLEKTVRNITKNTPEGTTNVGDIGDVLEYRLIFSNPSSQPVNNVTINDMTPAYTALTGPISSPVTVAPGIICSLAVPTSNAAGYAGPLEWSCPGTFPPGQNGSLTFRVTISP